MPISKCVVKLRAIDRGGSRFAGDIEIEVASEHDRRAYLVCPGIFQGFLNLGAAQSIIALTLQVQVISDKMMLCADRKSTRLNSSHQIISYAVFCFKKKKILQRIT